MSFFQSLVTWANLPFTAAIATVVTFAGLQATGVLGLLAGGDADTDGADADADADADHELDHDVDHDVDHDHDGHHALGSVLATVGVGRLPTTIVWQTFAMSFGMVGVVASSIYLEITRSLPTAALVFSLPAGLVGGFALTGLAARVLGRLVQPAAEAPGRRHLVGLTGVVVSGSVDGEFGEVRVRAQSGDFVQVHCRTLPNDRPIQHHEPIIVVSYDADHDCLYVAPISESSGLAAAESPGRIKKGVSS